MKIIIRYLKKYKFLFLLNFFAIVSFVIVELGIPTITGIMIDQGIVMKDQDLLNQMGLILIGLALIGGLGSVLSSYTSTRLATLMTRDIRNDMFHKMQEFSHSEYSAFGVSSMITRITGDVYQLQLFTQMLLKMGLMTPLMIITSFSLIFKTNINLAWISALCIPFIILVITVIAKRSHPLSTNQQQSMDELNRITRENITGVRVIRAFRKDSDETKRFGKANARYAQISKRLFRIMSMTEPLFFFIFHLIVLAIFWAAAFMINDQSLQVGSLVSFLEYQFHGLFSLMLFANVFIMYPRAAVSANRIEAILTTDPIVQNPINGITKTDNPVSITFDNVSFSYPDGEADVLHNINFSAKAGETIAFIGSTGSGKSTLINLIVRFYDVSRGKVLVNGVDVRDYDLASLRSHIGFIPQKANLFSGTIASNIRYGKPHAAMEEIIQSADISAARPFIEAKPNQYDDWLSEGGSNLSGGQKQRMSIARALVRQPDIYIFDDSFSALDYKTDATIRQNLKTITAQSIVLVVAQRISSIVEADKIIVLNEGHLVGQGTHRELMRDCAIYQEIAASQLSEKEIAAYEKNLK